MLLLLQVTLHILILAAAAQDIHYGTFSTAPVYSWPIGHHVSNRRVYNWYCSPINDHTLCPNSVQRSRSADNKIITTGDDTGTESLYSAKRTTCIWAFHLQNWLVWPSKDLERSFLQELRELKHVMLAKDVYEEFYQLCCKKLNEKGSENSRVAAAIKIVFPGMLQIGAGLSHRYVLLCL